jgi:hypothetical protein
MVIYVTFSKEPIMETIYIDPQNLDFYTFQNNTLYLHVLNGYGQFTYTGKEAKKILNSLVKIGEV